MEPYITDPGVDEAPLDSGPFDLPGPRFISNLEGVLLEMNTNKEGLVTANEFKGGRSQQWLLQFHPTQPNKVALASLHDGRYLTFRLPTWENPDLGDLIVFADKTRFYWDLTKRTGIYRFTTPIFPEVGRLRAILSLPVNVGRCKLGPMTGQGPTVGFLILGNSDRAKTALQTGNIGRYAYPNSPIYYTIGRPRMITIFNHLDTPINAAVAGSGNTTGWEVAPGESRWWIRSEACDVHITFLGLIKSQSAKVYPCSPGKILHIQSMASENEWEGLESVLQSEATYTANPFHLKSCICVKNNVSFTVYAVVLDSTSDTAIQYQIQPGKTSWWPRTHPELVLVCIGGPSGTPRAYMGRVGFTLHIYSHNH